MVLNRLACCLWRLGVRGASRSPRKKSGHVNLLLAMDLLRMRPESGCGHGIQCCIFYCEWWKMQFFEIFCSGKELVSLIPRTGQIMSWEGIKAEKWLVVHTVCGSIVA